MSDKKIGEKLRAMDRKERLLWILHLCQQEVSHADRESADLYRRTAARAREELSELLVKEACEDFLEGMAPDLPEAVPETKKAPGGEKKKKQAAPKKKEEPAGTGEEKPLRAVAYTDGSYFPEDGVYGYGVRFCYNGKEKQMHGGDQAIEGINYAGEIRAVERALQYAISLDVRDLEIRYDFSSIPSMASEKYKTNKPFLQEYQKMVKTARKKMDLKFVHVKGHSGDEGNATADMLARLGAEEARDPEKGRRTGIAYVKGYTSKERRYGCAALLCAENRESTYLDKGKLSEDNKDTFPQYRSAILAIDKAIKMKLQKIEIISNQKALQSHYDAPGKTADGKQFYEDVKKRREKIEIVFTYKKEKGEQKLKQVAQLAKEQAQK